MRKPDENDNSPKLDTIPTNPEDPSSSQNTSTQNSLYQEISPKWRNNKIEAPNYGFFSSEKFIIPKHPTLDVFETVVYINYDDPDQTIRTASRNLWIAFPLTKNQYLFGSQIYVSWNISGRQWTVFNGDPDPIFKWLASKIDKSVIYKGFEKVFPCTLR